MSNRKCEDCGCQLGHDEGYRAEGRKKDVCEQCYLEIVSTCQLCGDDDIMPSDVSEYILCKAELSTTCRTPRPPGIFRILRRPFLSIPMIGSGSMDGNDVLFIDKLPKFDRHYDISGHICKKCSAPYDAKFSQIYVGVELSTYTRTGWNKARWIAEREHTRSTILKNPDMLRDLEWDSYKYHPNTSQEIKGADTARWEELREAYLLPHDVPTFHEWMILEYKGVRVYTTCRSKNDGSGWLVLRPEPRYRHFAYGGKIELGILFCASGLPTYKHYDSDAPRNKGKYHDNYYWNRIQSIPAIKKAIREKILTQHGTFDKSGKPIECN